MNKKEKILREFISNEIKKILQEGEITSLSGMNKTKETKLHTNSKKENKPVTKVAKDAPNKSVTAEKETVEKATDKKDKDDKNVVDDLYEKGKPQTPSESFETEDLGVKLEVKGQSMASVNYTYIISQMRKLLEGKGQYVKSIKIEMGNRDEKEEK